MTTTPESLIAEVDRLVVVATKASWTPYPDYRDTGADWLGRVPQHWGEKRLKYAVDLINDKTDDSDGLQYIGLEQIESWTGRLIEPETPIVPDGTACRFEADDVLFGKLRPYLAKAYRATARGVCTAEALVLRSRDTIPDYLRYYLLTRQFIEVVDGSTYGSKMPRANWQFIGALPCVLPPPNEQYAIAAFLDRKTREIDELIEKKRRLIELLQEQRTALISHAVTKGLNPDAPMKPSGVEWLGDVPEHWEVKPLKYLSSKIGSGKTPRGGAEVYVSDGVMLLRSQNIYDDGLRLHDVVFIDEETDAEMAGTRVFPGDVLLNITGASIGRASITPDSMPPANVNQHVCIIRPAQIAAGFLHAFLCSKAVKDWIRSEENGTSREGLNFRQVGSMPLPLPPEDEQDAIIASIERSSAAVDAMRLTVERAIEGLIEYRQALISAAVTGKIDVREAIAGQELSDG